MEITVFWFVFWVTVALMSGACAGIVLMALLAALGSSEYDNEGPAGF